MFRYRIKFESVWWSQISELTGQLEFSIIKNRVPAKAIQMTYKIYKDKYEKSGESKRYCSYDCCHYFKVIVYSKSKASLFCLACVLFPMPAHEGSRVKILTTNPYNGWKHGLEELKAYLILQYHKDSMAHFQSLITTMKNIESRIENRVNENSEDSIRQNRKLLSSVICSFEYCVWQVIGNPPTTETMGVSLIMMIRIKEVSESCLN